MKKINPREKQRLYRHSRIRKKVLGTDERPRLYVHRSLKNFSAQIINDIDSKVLVGMTTQDKGIKSDFENCGNVAAAAKLGQSLAAKAKENGISKVCFDRGGYRYHGRVKAFADAAREAGLEF